MIMHVRRFLPLLVVAALLAAALGVASVGAAGPATRPAFDVPSAPQRISALDEEEPTPEFASIDLAKPYDWMDPACAGWKLRYTLRFTNTGTIPLTNVVLSNTIPSLSYFVPEDGSAGAIYQQPDNVRWEMSSVSPGEIVRRDVVIHIYSNVPKGTIITDTVRVFSDQIVSEIASEGTVVDRCPGPTATITKTPTITETPIPTETPTATPTSTPTPTLEPGRRIWLPIVLKSVTS